MQITKDPWDGVKVRGVKNNPYSKETIENKVKDRFYITKKSNDYIISGVEFIDSYPTPEDPDVLTQIILPAHLMRGDDLKIDELTFGTWKNSGLHYSPRTLPEYFQLIKILYDNRDGSFGSLVCDIKDMMLNLLSQYELATLTTAGQSMEHNYWTCEHDGGEWNGYFYPAKTIDKMNNDFFNKLFRADRWTVKPILEWFGDSDQALEFDYSSDRIAPIYMAFEENQFKIRKRGFNTKRPALVFKLRGIGPNEK